MGNSSDRLTVKMGLKLSQIIGVDMKRQIMITNVWVEQVKIKFFKKLLLGSGDSIKSFLKGQFLGVWFLGLQFLTLLASEGPHKPYLKNRTPKKHKKLINGVKDIRMQFLS